MQPLNADRMAGSGHVYDCHYIGLAFTWKSGVTKKKKKNEIKETNEKCMTVNW